MGASTWGWCMTGQQRLPGRLYGFCTRCCNREQCRIRTGPRWPERLLLSSARAPRESPDATCLVELELLLSSARAPQDSPDATCLVELELLLSGARAPRNSPNVISQAVLELLGSALGAGTWLVPQCFPGRLYGFCARRCNRERCRIRSGPGWLEQLLLAGAGKPWNRPSATWLAVLGLASSNSLLLEAVRGGRKVSSTATQPQGRRGPPGAKPTLSPCYQA